MVNDSQDRRLMRLFIAPSALAGIFQDTLNGNALMTVSKGLPKGIKIVGMNIDTSRGGFSLTINHPDFAEVPEGGVIPHLKENIEIKLVKIQKPVPQGK